MSYGIQDRDLLETTQEDAETEEEPEFESGGPEEGG